MITYHPVPLPRLRHRHDILPTSSIPHIPQPILAHSYNPRPPARLIRRLRHPTRNDHRGQHFKSKRALAMGLVCTRSFLGGIGFPLTFDKLVPKVGFPNALRLIGLKIAVCYSLALFLSTSKPSGNSTSKGRASSLVDSGGGRGCRYTVLCVGMWFATLGLWIPAYYISELRTLRKLQFRLANWA